MYESEYSYDSYCGATPPILLVVAELGQCPSLCGVSPALLVRTSVKVHDEHYSTYYVRRDAML